MEYEYEKLDEETDEDRELESLGVAELNADIANRYLDDMEEVARCVARCECEHLEAEHADEDYDFEDGRYVKCARPCQVSGCGCENWWVE